MGIKLKELGIYTMKGVIFTIRGCYRSACHHPFLACVLCALIYISRSFPFMFSLLVSASPVLLCTATLLGTLLFYGQQNIPEHEKEKKTAYKAVAVAVAPKTEPSVDANIDVCVEKHSEDKRDEVEKIAVAVESELLVNKLDEIGVASDVEVAASLDKERRSFGVESETGENSEADGELDYPVQQKNSEWNEEKVSDGDGEVMMDHYAIISKVIGELLESESEQEKSGGDSEGDDESSDLGSDGDESSSPDESVDGVRMRPMLDELHPLLDEDIARPVHMSRVGSDASSTEQSQPSSNSSIESDDETEVRDSDVADDDEDEDDDDEVQGEVEDQTKPIITWTEEDQKNLMEVGSSEIERNHKLEKILRRRKNMSMVPEINLIDFENPDFQFHIPPISTGVRQNPFDLPHDSDENSVPGSAPSVLAQKRNPFDTPDDSKEGDQTEREEEFRGELRQSQQTRHPFFRRRGAVGPSVFSPLRPFFVSEHTVVEDSSGVSSVQETESVTSLDSFEEQKLDETNVHQDQEELNEQEHVVTEQTVVEDSNGMSSVPETESVSSIESLEEQKLDETDVHQDKEIPNKQEHVVSEQLVVEDSDGVSSVSATESVSSVESLEEQKLDETDVHLDQEVPNEQEHVVSEQTVVEDSNRVSSVSETESVSSVESLEERKLDETDVHQDQEVRYEKEHFNSEHMAVEDSNGVSSVPETESVSLVESLEEQKVDETDVHQYQEVSNEQEQVVSEQMVVEDSNGVSYVPETESASSVESYGEQKLDETDVHQDQEVPNEQEHVVSERTVVENSNGVSSVPVIESVSSVESLEEQKLDETNAHRDLEVPNEQEHVVSEQTVVEDLNGVSSVPAKETVSSVESLEGQKLDETDVHQDQEVPNEQEHVEHRGHSSDDGEPLKVGSDSVALAPDTLRQASAENADLSVAVVTLANDVPTREPVNDMSPSSVGNTYSSTSSFSDVNAEADKRTQGEVPSSSSHSNDMKQGDLEGEKNSPKSVEGRLQVEHSVNNGETVGAANEKLNSTKPVKGSSSPFYKRAKNWLGFGHQAEVKVPKEEAGKVASSKGKK